jgi:hypothetical protein
MKMTKFISTKTTLKILLLSVLLWSCSQEIPEDDHWPKIKRQPEITNFVDFPYSKVIAFGASNVMLGGEFFMERKLDLSKFEDTVCITLNENQIKSLTEISSGRLNKDTLVDYGADCFVPRHNIIFLNEKDSVLHYICVCFDCGRIIGSKKQLGSLDNYIAFFNSIGLNGFADPTRYKGFLDSLKASRKPKK